MNKKYDFKLWRYAISFDFPRRRVEGTRKAENKKNHRNMQNMHIKAYHYFKVYYPQY